MNLKLFLITLQSICKHLCIGHKLDCFFFPSFMLSFFLFLKLLRQQIIHPSHAFNSTFVSHVTLLTMINIFSFSMFPYGFLQFIIIIIIEQENLLLIYIYIYIYIMDMKRHMLICFHISMLVGRGKEGGSYQKKVK